MAKLTVKVTGEEINRDLAKTVIELESRAEKAEEQFDELSVIHNRVKRERDQWRIRFKTVKALRDHWHDIAIEAEADLAEAREVLRALRPVLRTTWTSPYPMSIAQIRQWGIAKQKLPWLDEWLEKWPPSHDGD